MQWEQPNLFDQPPPIEKDALETLETAMREAKTDADRSLIEARLKRMEPEGFWNGTVWSLPEDIPF